MAINPHPNLTLKKARRIKDECLDAIKECEERHLAAWREAFYKRKQTIQKVIDRLETPAFDREG